MLVAIYSNNNTPRSAMLLDTIRPVNPYMAMAVHIPIYGHIWIWIRMVIFFYICICIWKVIYFPPYMVRIWHIRGIPKPHPQFIFSPFLYNEIYFCIINIPLKYINILFIILNLLTFVNFFWSALQ